ncbi:hypothetical protein NDU88_006085 [Pleurodeles waltl]|uniref:Uncharacterized protein n=1 Tax=Pleurodeles waltl TaxID=8319 RepID=A0AAV7TEI3_PLEWA|nr:hypothetical protein NDU88_006085 [Pleurodeles waltl]
MAAAAPRCGQLVRKETRTAWCGEERCTNPVRQEPAPTVKELKGEVTELGQRVHTMERTCNRQEENLDLHQQEIIAYQDGNRDTQYRFENLENRF